ncbi:hypothetical protein VIGAN_07109600 [Vigna angularis var. angularis]|uniref:Uncharacterized protein n=1 Tax=Vigna angularis var. angularis TaxID=157739 RepID=A0A0S3SHT4_PHAAN|nr:hypothetical protein VIGAN_07109600 [Vigna angularis var. angularis]
MNQLFSLHTPGSSSLCCTCWLFFSNLILHVYWTVSRRMWLLFCAGWWTKNLQTILLAGTLVAGFSFCSSHLTVVSSMEWPLISKYRACVRTQSPRVEMIDNLFKKVSDGVDEGIIRNGVIESQFNQVLNIELHQIINGRNEKKHEGFTERKIKQKLELYRDVCMEYKGMQMDTNRFETYSSKKNSWEQIQNVIPYCYLHQRKIPEKNSSELQALFGKVGFFFVSSYLLNKMNFNLQMR